MACERMISGSGPRNNVVSSMNLETHCFSRSVRACRSFSVVVMIVLLFSVRSVLQEPHGALSGGLQVPPRLDEEGGVLGRDDRRTRDHVLVRQRVLVVDRGVHCPVVVDEVDVAMRDGLRNPPGTAVLQGVEADDVAVHV